MNCRAKLFICGMKFDGLYSGNIIHRRSRLGILNLFHPAFNFRINWLEPLFFRVDVHRETAKFEDLYNEEV
jgi:hypothetical protein